MQSNRATTRPVVVEVDDSIDGQHVVDYAYREAARSGAELMLIAAYPTTMPPQQLESPSVLAERCLQQAAERLVRRWGDDLRVSTTAMPGPRPSVLPRAAERAGLLVVGKGRDAGPRGLVAAQANLFLAGRSGCPVIVVPPAWRPSTEERSVAVGVDGTQLSLEAVEFAFRVAAERRGDLTVVHSHRTPYRIPAPRPGQNAWIQRAGLTVAETLAGWDEEYPNVTVTRLLTSRPVVDALAHESAQVGLVVLGCHAGSLPMADPIARQAIAAVSGPVAIVPHHVTPTEQDRRSRELATEPVAVSSP